MFFFQGLSEDTISRIYLQWRFHGCGPFRCRGVRNLVPVITDCIDSSRVSCIEIPGYFFRRTSPPSPSYSCPPFSPQHTQHTQDNNNPQHTQQTADTTQTMSSSSAWGSSRVGPRDVRRFWRDFSGGRLCLMARAEELLRILVLVMHAQ